MTTDGRTISINALLAYVAASAALILALAIGFGFLSQSWTMAGVVFIAVAHLQGMRCWMTRSRELERNAFDLGRDSVRSIH